MRYMYLLSLLFIMAACTDQVHVTIKNKSDLSLTNESIVIDWKSISAKLNDATAGNVIVCDTKGNEIASQIIYEGGNDPAGVLFQACMTPNSENSYTIKTGTPQAHDTLAYGRFVPERKDDFTWENDKIAYRMYGPALETSGEISNGIDIWLKRTPKMVVDKWYVKGYDYHSDSGEGLDCYKVGRTLGAGANTPVLGDSLVMSNNFISYRILDKGILRIKFELLYAPFVVEGVDVSQKRVITLDAGNHLNTIATTYSGNFDRLDIATGIVIRNEAGEQIQQTPNAIAYSQPEDQANGITYALVITKDKGESRRVKDHILKFASVKSGETYVYRSGGYWSKYGIEKKDDWSQMIEKESQRIHNELEIIIN